LLAKQFKNKNKNGLGGKVVPVRFEPVLIKKLFTNRLDAKTGFS